ncbi:MAG: questin oxidase family protein [Jatrophihabitantaceae bacterium]
MEILDEAYERFRDTGPEWGGNLSNHGPMAVEVLARREFPTVIPRWVDAYLPRLDRLPPAAQEITDGNWTSALGDFGRIADWTGYFNRQLEQQPWRAVLATWWPRLLPGVAAGATHGLIRTSHAVRTLSAGDESAAAVGELARGLAFWAALATAIPGVGDPDGRLDPAAALAAVPRIREQEGPLAGRFVQLGDLADWPDAVAALRPAADAEAVPRLLGALVDAATLRYLTHGHAGPVLLVHTATAPNAVLHTLPALPMDLWRASLTAAWAACAAITSTYGPAAGVPRDDLPGAPRDADPVAEVLDRAVTHGDEHVIKFTDTAAEVYTRTGNPDALAAALRSGELIGSGA